MRVDVRSRHEDHDGPRARREYLRVFGSRG
jgi:hypothetical protein